jgi:sodium pump decarboxylase gamma subunit
MTIVEMLKQSAILTVLGMTIVFVFLWLMIISMNALAWLVRKLGWDKDIQSKNETPQKVNEIPKITAAISAAVTEYRKEEAGHNE